MQWVSSCQGLRLSLEITFERVFSPANIFLGYTYKKMQPRQDYSMSLQVLDPFIMSIFLSMIYVEHANQNEAEEGRALEVE